ncbi:MAG TPA: hypothetical protein VGU45_00435 [Microvirga sp.]|jgi:hypothetical protein|nr:hypothetical protein [Microvirga sp.]
MNVSSAGIASSWSAARPTATQVAVDTALLKQQAKAEESVVALLEPAVEAAKQPASPPPGQGLHVDVQA